MARVLPILKLKFLHFSNNDTAAKELALHIRAGDKILIKGSRGMKTEEILDNTIGHYRQIK